MALNIEHWRIIWNQIVPNQDNDPLHRPRHGSDQTVDPEAIWWAPFIRPCQCDSMLQGPGFGVITLFMLPYPEFYFFPIGWCVGMLNCFAPL